VTTNLLALGMGLAAGAAYASGRLAKRVVRLPRRSG
jgi:hypothetical protein